MDISQQQIGDVTVSKLTGALDAAAAPTADTWLRDLIAASVVRIVFDLGELS